MQWDIWWNISIVWDISNFLGSHMSDISKVCDFWPEISHQISPMWESPKYFSVIFWEIFIHLFILISEYKVPTTNIKLSRGDKIVISPYSQMDPKYFPDPYKFDPTRFDDSNKMRNL